MKILRNLIDKQRRLYHAPDAKLHKFWPLFDAFETFLFTPDDTTPRKGVHIRDYMDVKRMMWTVIVALTPALLWSFWNTGHQHFLGLASLATEGVAYTPGWLQWLLSGGDYSPNPAAPGFFDEVVFGLQKMIPILIVSYGVGLGIEMMFSVWRKEEVSEGFLVSGMLIALIVPASIPLWQLALAVAFSVVLVKEVFGGTGMNVFNVALMSRAFLFFGYPAQISGDAVWVAGNGPTNLIDGLSKATPLAVGAASRIQEAHPDVTATAEGVQTVQSGVVEGMTYLQDGKGNEYFATASDAVREAGYSWWDMFLGTIPGSTGETSALCALLGALLLVVTGVGSWRTMFSGVVGLVVGALLMNLTWGTVDGIGSLTVWDHLVMGGFMFGVVFMATDPVTSPETHRGKWVYGFLIGFVTVLVRAVNPAYPEGMMLSILLLNAFAPTIDHFVLAANIRRRKARLG